MQHIAIMGVDRLAQGLRRRAKLDAVRQTVRQSGEQLAEGMRRQADAAFVRGYATGATAGSVHAQMADDGLTAEVRPETPYSVFLEYGTRDMLPEPFVRPAFDAHKGAFVRALEQLMK